MTAVGKSISPYMPREAFAVFERERQQGRGPVLMSQLEGALLSRLRMLGREDFAGCPTPPRGSKTACSPQWRSPTLDGVLAAAKSKRYALARLRRMCMCACLGVKAGMNEGTPPYARLLAASGRGREMLRMIEGRSSVPVITQERHRAQTALRGARVLRADGASPVTSSSWERRS